MDTHAQQLQAILDAATSAAVATPTAANIAAVEKARKALDDYTVGASGDAGERFATQAAALEYLQRIWQIEKSKLSKDVTAGKVPKKDGHFTAADLDFYARAVHLRPRTIELKPTEDHDDRLKRAQAEEREIRVAKLRGELIDAAQEEARDARLWFAVRTDLENHAPVIVNELLNRIADIGIPEEITARIADLAPELRTAYEDALAEIFDRYARAGGIEA